MHDLLVDEDSQELFYRSVVFRLLHGFSPVDRVMEISQLIEPKAWAKEMEDVETVPGVEDDTPEDSA